MHQGVAVVQRKRPVAAGVHAEAAVLACHIGLRNEHHGVRSRIRCLELAAGLQRDVLLYRTRAVAGNAGNHHAAFVAAVDGDRDVLDIHAALAIADLDLIGLGARFARLQGLGCSVVELVGPLALGIDTEAAIGARGAAHHAIGVRVPGIHVGGGQLAYGGLRAVFGHRARQCTREHGLVIRSIDGDDHAARGSVGRRHREGLGARLTCSQTLHQGVAVVQRKRPVAAGIDAEAAVAARLRRHGHEHSLAFIRIDDIELAARGQRHIFLHHALVRARNGGGNDCAFVGAVDGDGHGLRIYAPLAIADLDLIGLGTRFARAQRLGRVVVELVGPLSIRAHAEAAVGAGGLAHYAVAVRVVGIDICGDQLADRGLDAIFRHGAGERARQFGLVVGANNGDDHATRGSVDGGDRECLTERLACAQGLHLVAAIVQRKAPVATGVDAEAAVLARCIGLRHEHGLARIRVGHIKLAAGGQHRVFLHPALVGARCRGRDDRAVVRTFDDDGDGLRRAAALAVADSDSDGVGELLACLESLHLCIARAGYIGPLARLVHGETAVLTLAAIGHAPGLRVADIDIRGNQLSAHGRGLVLQDRHRRFP